MTCQLTSISSKTETVNQNFLELKKYVNKYN